MSLLSWLNPIGKAIDAIGAFANKKVDADLEKYKVDGIVDQGLIRADAERIQAVKELNLARMAYTPHP